MNDVIKSTIIALGPPTQKYCVKAKVISVKIEIILWDLMQWIFGITQGLFVCLFLNFEHQSFFMWTGIVLTKLLALTHFFIIRITKAVLSEIAGYA